MKCIPVAVLALLVILDAAAQSGGNVSSQTAPAPQDVKEASGKDASKKSDSLADVPSHRGDGPQPSEGSPLPGTAEAALTAAVPDSTTIPSEKKEKNYTRSERDGIVIAKEDRWYLEEYDSLERPVAGTLWEKGKITRETSWIYGDDSQQPVTKLVTDDTGSTETGYDESGNVTSLTVSDADGKTVSTLANVYDRNNMISSSILTKDKTVTRTTYSYNASGMLVEKRIYTNDMLSIIYAWHDEENWTETLYSKDRQVLVATYTNGVRRKDFDEKKH